MDEVISSLLVQITTPALVGVTIAAAGALHLLLSRKIRRERDHAIESLEDAKTQGKVEREAKENAEARADQAEAAIAHALDARGALIRQFEVPARRRARSIPIIAFGNLKGGVGKSTLSANIGAYFADTQRPDSYGPTLFIDLDFQASLTNFFLGVQGFAPPERWVSRVFHAEHGLSSSDLNSLSERTPYDRLGQSRYFAADFDIGNDEEKHLLSWLVKRRGDDPRLALLEFLHSDVVQNTYGQVVIDLPPRNALFNTAGLVAATHVVIATRDDPTSTIAAARFAGFLARGRDAGIWPALKIAGVAAPQVQSNQMENARGRLLSATADVNTAWAEHMANAHSQVPLLGLVPYMSYVGTVAGSEIAYFCTVKSEGALGKPPHEHFALLGQAIASELG